MASKLTNLDTDLSSRLFSLSKEEMYFFNKKFIDVLNDRYSCFLYGSISEKDYADMTPDKIQTIKLNLYKEMFENVTPPSKISLEFPASKS